MHLSRVADVSQYWAATHPSWVVNVSCELLARASAIGIGGLGRAEDENDLCGVLDAKASSMDESLDVRGVHPSFWLMHIVYAVR